MSLSGDRIRSLRLSRRLTLDDVARYLGVGRQAVYKYEQGTVTNIPLENLEKMAKLFGTSPEYLAGWVSDDEYLQRWYEYQDSQHPPDSPHTLEARIISGGIDKMPPERREQALKILQVAFAEYADYFKEDSDNDT